MSVGQLLQALRRLGDLYSAGGAVTQAKDLRLLIEAIEPDEALTLAEFAAAVGEASKAKPKKPPKPVKGLDAAVLESFLNQLKQAHDLDEVEAIISIMKHDKIDRDHIFAITARFCNGEPRYKSANEAFARIKSVFVQQKRFENKLKAAHLD